jgi:hypothetical protein
MVDGIRSQASPHDFFMIGVAVEQVFLPVHWSSSVSIILLTLRTH